MGGRDPNDAKCVVWAICKLGSIDVFIQTSYQHQQTTHHVNVSNMSTASTRQLWMGGDDENGPKRRQTCRLGPKYVFIYILRFFSY
jgi:hypothetical protein